MHAIDLDERAAANALTNAFRNGVADRMTAATVDLFPWVPEEAYDVIVASLYQTPVDPLEQVTTHRPLDYWGRNLIDHLIGKLPEALAPGGVAYVMQLSIIGQRRTAELLEARGFAARVVDFALLRVPRAVRGQEDADPARRGAVRRLPPDARGPGRDGRLPARDPPRRADHLPVRVGNPPSPAGARGRPRAYGSGMASLSRRRPRVSVMRGGSPVIAHYGSVATEVALCVKRAGIVERPELCVLELAGQAPFLEHVLDRALGELAPAPARAAGGRRDLVRAPDGQSRARRGAAGEPCGALARARAPLHARGGRA